MGFFNYELIITNYELKRREEKILNRKERREHKDGKESSYALLFIGVVSVSSVDNALCCGHWPRLNGFNPD
jgi:hypothetical protein